MFREQPRCIGVEDSQSLMDSPSPSDSCKVQTLNSPDISQYQDFPYNDFLKHRCIFVHIPKCAGIGVARSLFGEYQGSHRSIKDFSTVFSRQEFTEFFKFTIVRNPWDRLVSAYCYLKKGGMHRGDQVWAEEHLSSYKDFDEFVREWVSFENIQKGIHFLPQYSFISMPKFSMERGVQIPLDFIGSYENLAQDFSTIQQQLGLQQTLLHENQTARAHKDYRSYYSSSTQEIVAQVYREDIALFGYDFDNSPRRYGGRGLAT